MSFRGYFYTRRGRILAVLTGLALVTLTLALLALHHRAAMVAPRYEEATFLPGLAHALTAGEVTRIHIVSKTASFDVAFVPAKGWVLPDSGNFPAAFDVVKKSLVALAALQTVEPKTDNPELYSYLGLDAPPQGDGVAVTLSNDKGKVLASLILGKPAPLGDAIGFFVRKTSDKQSWLVKSPSEIRTSPADWMDKTVVAIKPTRVASVTIEPATGPGYTVSRNAATDPAFSVAPLPKGRELTYDGAGDGVAMTLSDFSFDDIKPALALDFTSAAHMSLHTFDGLTVSIDIAAIGTEHWVRLSATSDPGKAAAAKEALAINAHASGWAFKLPAYKASLFAQPLETLLKPKGK